MRAPRQRQRRTVRCPNEPDTANLPTVPTPAPRITSTRPCRDEDDPSRQQPSGDDRNVRLSLEDQEMRAWHVSGALQQIVGSQSVLSQELVLLQADVDNVNDDDDNNSNCHDDNDNDDTPAESALVPSSEPSTYTPPCPTRSRTVTASIKTKTRHRKPPPPAIGVGSTATATAHTTTTRTKVTDSALDATSPIKAARRIGLVLTQEEEELSDSGDPMDDNHPPHGTTRVSDPTRSARLGSQQPFSSSRATRPVPMPFPGSPASPPAASILPTTYLELGQGSSASPHTSGKLPVLATSPEALSSPLKPCRLSQESRSTKVERRSTDRENFEFSFSQESAASTNTTDPNLGPLLHAIAIQQTGLSQEPLFFTSSQDYVYPTVVLPSQLSEEAEEEDSPSDFLLRPRKSRRQRKRKHERIASESDNEPLPPTSKNPAKRASTSSTKKPPETKRAISESAKVLKPTSKPSTTALPSTSRTSTNPAATTLPPSPTRSNPPSGNHSSDLSRLQSQPSAQTQQSPCPTTWSVSYSIPSPNSAGQKSKNNIKNNIKNDAQLRQSSTASAGATGPTPEVQKAAQLAARVLHDPDLAKALLLRMALVRESPRPASQRVDPPPGTILAEHFVWAKFPSLENVLKLHMLDYYQLSMSSCQSNAQQEYNNRLVTIIRGHVYRKGWTFCDRYRNSTEVKPLRDRIRCYYKTHIQNAKKRLRTMLRNPTKKASAKHLVAHYDLIQETVETSGKVQAVAETYGSAASHSPPRGKKSPKRRIEASSRRNKEASEDSLSDEEERATLLV